MPKTIRNADLMNYIKNFEIGSDANKKIMTNENKIREIERFINNLPINCLMENNRFEWIAKVGKMSKNRYYVSVPERVGELVHRKVVRVIVEVI